MDNALIEQQLAQAERHVAKDRRTSNASAKWSANWSMIATMRRAQGIAHPVSGDLSQTPARLLPGSAKT